MQKESLQYMQAGMKANKPIDMNAMTAQSHQFRVPIADTQRSSSDICKGKASIF
jgi:hypothetical protein